MSIEIQEHITLAPYTTLMVGGIARYFIEVHSEQEIMEALAFAEEHGLRVVVLGGGSNVLVADDGLNALVLSIKLKGVSHIVVGEQVLLTAFAGESLDAVVAHTVQNGWWGMENLSHIPGSVGAVPVQNVGAYGVEVKDCIQSVRAIDINTKEVTELSNEACVFGYRDSLFKHEEGKRYIITAVTFALSLAPAPQITYKDLALAFEGREPSQREIREAVITIRSGKFPDWKQIGTAGSFFNNPIVDAETYTRIHAQYPELPAYPAHDGMMKLSLGWILDKALGLRGYTEGNVGLYEKQALVLVARDGATESEITAFARSIIARVRDVVGVEVECEVTHIV